MTGPRGDECPEFSPLGKKIDFPAPPKPEWRPVPDKPHLEQNAQGQLRTKIPENNAAIWPFSVDVRILDALEKITK
jgi:hypothetical protein